MALLTTSDFRDTQVKAEVARDQEYINNDLVTQYWYDLASKYNVPKDNLPLETAIEPLVKCYLVCVVAMQVCTDNIGSNLQQIAEGVVADQWGIKLTELKNQKKDILTMMSSDYIYDPNNAPESTTDSRITRMIRG